MQMSSVLTPTEQSPKSAAAMRNVILDDRHMSKIKSSMFYRVNFMLGA